VSIGSAGSERTITNVAAGRLSATSTDAVNGSQLFATNQKVTQNSTDIASLSNDINNINNGTAGLVQQDPATQNITVAKDTGGTLVDFTGKDGVRKLTGIADGDVSAGSHDAVTGGQFYELSKATTDALGGGATVNADGTITGPSYTLTNADGTTTSVTSVGDAISNLDGRVTTNTNSINSIDQTLNNITNGSAGIKYFHANSTLADSTATGADAVAIGGNAQALAKNAVALGAGSVADQDNTVSVGSQDQQRRITNVAAGKDDTDAVNVAQLKAAGVIDPNGNTNTAVTYDHNADGSTNYSSISMGNNVAGGTTIHNVAAGTVDSDAVNVGQMNSALSNIANIASNANNPLFAADGNRDTEAASAIGTHSMALGASANASAGNAVAMGAGSVASGDASMAMGANANASGKNAVALGAGSVADQDNTVSVGSAGNERRITNVAKGTQATDAVNVDQLNAATAQAAVNIDNKVNQAVSSANSYTDQQIGKLSHQMNTLGAAAMAASSLIPNARAEGNFQMAAAAGTYGGQTALALGANFWASDRLLLNAHVTRSTGSGASTGASVGATFGF